MEPVAPTQGPASSVQPVVPSLQMPGLKSTLHLNPLAHRLTPAATVSRDSTPDVGSTQAQLIRILNIPESLTTRENVTDLRIAYGKYLGYLRANATMIKMRNDGSWVGKVPKGEDLITVFVSKSTWYEKYVLFGHVEKHPDLQDWLEADPASTVTFWPEVKTRYTFEDLIDFLVESGDIVVKKKGKGKGKRKAAGSVSEGSGKKKEKKQKKKSTHGSNKESSSSS
jgi:hypothetical protein